MKLETPSLPVGAPHVQDEVSNSRFQHFEDFVAFILLETLRIVGSGIVGSAAG